MIGMQSENYVECLDNNWVWLKLFHRVAKHHMQEVFNETKVLFWVDDWQALGSPEGNGGQSRHFSN